MKVGTFLISVFLCTLIFAADMIFHLGAISLFYIMYIMITYVTSRSKSHIFAATAISLLLSTIGWLFNNRTTEVVININNAIQGNLNYENLFRTVTTIILVFIGFIFLNQKNKDDELIKVNETLELRVLARTSKSEHKVKVLERQIEILQNIRTEKTNESISKLDLVISELKQLSHLEKADGN